MIPQRDVQFSAQPLALRGPVPGNTRLDPGDKIAPIADRRCVAQQDTRPIAAALIFLPSPDPLNARCVGSDLKLQRRGQRPFIDRGGGVAPDQEAMVSSYFFSPTGKSIMTGGAKLSG